MRYLCRDIQRFKTRASTDNCGSYMRANHPATIERPARPNPTQNDFELADEYGDGSEKYEEDFNEVEGLNASLVAEDLDLDGFAATAATATCRLYGKINAFNIEHG